MKRKNSRQRRYALILLDGMMGKPVKIDMAEFWGRVEVDTSSPHGCWLWRGGRNKDGYGRFYLRGSISPEHPWGRKVSAHRVSYLWVYGPRALFAADGTGAVEREVCHAVCDNPACVHPGHLAAMTHQENLQDMGRKGRQRLQRHPETSPTHVRPDWCRRGERSGRARLTDEDVLLIRKLYSAGGQTYKSLARRFSVAPSTIGWILRGQTWAHLLPAGPVGQRRQPASKTHEPQNSQDIKEVA